MPSSNFLKTARRLIHENPEVFEALMEFERTKRLPRVILRERVNVTIDSLLLRRVKRYCKERDIPLSRLVEKHLKEELRQQRL